MKGEICWEMRARREEMTGSLLRARIMNGKTKGRIKKFGINFNLAVIHTGTGVSNQPSIKQENKIQKSHY